MAPTTTFYLNRDRIETEVSPSLLLLDYIRKQRLLTGTKEGCKEGDCGACMVLVGEMGEAGMRYQPMTSCVMPVGEVHGKHVVTVEGLNVEGLTPVQQAIVDLGATQCGYCTPGFVVSITGMLLDPDKPLDGHSMNYALGNNLCRCTGYRSLKAGLGHLLRVLGANLPPERIGTLIAKGALPDYFLELPKALAEIPPVDAHPSAKVIAGGTDLYVQQGLHLPDEDVQLLGHRSDLRGIKMGDEAIEIGGLTTFEEFGTHPEIVAWIPEMPEYLLLMASWAIRNRATLAGNLVNASPIGDMTSLLLALDPEIVLVSPAGERSTLLRKFYLDYKVMDRAPDELLTLIRIPRRPDDTKFNWEKVSKRKSLDIATVNSGMRIRVAGGVIEDIGISLGGVAAIPLYLEQTCEWMQGKPLELKTVTECLERLQSAFTPISDVRGSADYRRLLARQFVIAHFTKLFPEAIPLDAFYEAH